MEGDVEIVHIFRRFENNTNFPSDWFDPPARCNN